MADRHSHEVALNEKEMFENTNKTKVFLGRETLFLTRVYGKIMHNSLPYKSPSLGKGDPSSPLPTGSHPDLEELSDGGWWMRAVSVQTLFYSFC